MHPIAHPPVTGALLAAADLLFDFSRHPIAQGSWQQSLATLQRVDLAAHRTALVTGAIVNVTEQRAATHMQARDPSLSTTRDMVERTSALATRIAASGVTTVVNIGIGGSDLGVQLTADVFAAAGLKRRLDLRFLSGLDPAEWRQAVATLDPQSTAFIVASKSFGTLETIELAAIARRWLGADANRRLYAVTSHPARAEAWGIDPDHVVPLDQTLGGRYSLWGGLNLALRAAWGDEPVADLLAGAHAMDQHFVRSPLDRNAPVMAAIARFINRNQRGLSSHAVVPYCWGLRRLPAYLQQLIMESLGKGVRRDGSDLDCDPCSAVWGATGTGAQHAFFQWLHQHPVGACVDLIAVRPEPNERGSMIQFASAVAQAQALALGHQPAQAHAKARHASAPGGRPSTFIALPEVSPHSLGALLSFYEASVFVESLLCDVNPFDQFAVEFGKQLIRDAEAALQGSADASLDAQSKALLHWARLAPTS